MDKYKVYLSKKQANAYESIKWLLSPSRREGKSYLICVILIEQALATLEPVQIVDHYFRYDLYHCKALIEKIYRESGLAEKYDLVFTNQDKFKLTPKAYDTTRYVLEFKTF